MSDIDGEFYHACHVGNLPALRQLLAAGANVNVKFYDTALGAAAEVGRFAVVRFLLDSGANIDGSNENG